MKTSEYMATDKYKRLNKIRESNNQLHNEILTTMRATEQHVIIFDPFQHDTLSGLTETNYMLARDKIIHGCSLLTNQMGLLELATLGEEKIYIVNNDSKLVEVSNETLDISRELRPAHNLFKLWRSGALGDQFR